MARTVAMYPNGASVPGGYDATYTTMAAMEASEASNSSSNHIDVEITNSDSDWTGARQDTTGVEFDGWDCDYGSSRYLNIYTLDDGAKPSADAFWDTNAYIHYCSDGNKSIEFDNDFSSGKLLDVIFTDIQLQRHTNDGCVAWLENGGRHGHIEFNRCWLQQDRSWRAFSSNGGGAEASFELSFVNCVFDGGSHCYDGVVDNVYLINCTLVNANDDALESGSNDVYPINCALFYNADDFNDSFPSGYPDTCASDQGAGEGTDGIDLTPGGDRDVDLHVTFVDPDGGDYRLTGVTTTANIIGVGVNQSEESRVPSVDIVGTARPTGASRPCIGAFEYYVEGAATFIPKTVFF